jgi:hypothetical protein
MGLFGSVRAGLTVKSFVKWHLDLLPKLKQLNLYLQRKIDMSDKELVETLVYVYALKQEISDYIFYDFNLNEKEEDILLEIGIECKHLLAKFPALLREVERQYERLKQQNRTHELRRVA